MNDNQIIDGALNYLADFVKNYSAMAGTIKMFAGSVAPDGWLLCNGQAVSRTTYSKLFNVIGTTYGEGDGSTTFNVPDLRGRTPVGVGTGTATNATAHTLGQKAGAESSSYTPAGTIGGTSITQAQLPAISATVNVRNVGNSSYNTLMSSTGKFSVEQFGDATRALALDSVTDQLQKLKFSVGSGNTHTHSWTGTAATINKMQPYLAVNYIICTGDDIDLTINGNPEYRSGSGTVTVPVASSGSPLVLLGTLPEGLWEVKLCCIWPASAGTINKNFGIYRGDNNFTSFAASPSGASTGYYATTVSRIIKVDGNTSLADRNIYLYAWQGGNSTVELDYRYQIVQLGGVVDRDYDYPIGEIRYTRRDDVSLTSGTSYKVKVDTLPKGVWLINARANIPANSTGIRSLAIFTGELVETGFQRLSAISGNETVLTAHRIVQITNDTIDRDVQIGVLQNSGSTLSGATITYKATQIGGNVDTQYINGAVFELKEENATGSSIAVNSTGQIIIPAPENAISLVGYYVTASTGTSSLTNVYAARYLNNDKTAQFVVRNNGTSALVPTITAQFLCVTNTQPVFVDNTYSNKVDALMEDTGWTNEGITNKYSYLNSFSYRIVGNICYVTFQTSGGSSPNIPASTWTVLGYLPTKARPDRIMYSAAGTRASANPGSADFQIDTDGKVAINPGVATQIWVGSMSYPIN